VTAPILRFRFGQSVLILDGPLAGMFATLGYVHFRGDDSAREMAVAVVVDGREHDVAPDTLVEDL
jgi:hypothetical protein